ncbi:DNA cytosine methyltransferase [Methylopila sp. M107]|uniref:DNA cytosine methyltransferase n=1 Tax=Methylopila sp. M107 TaxID=1101190 RepID=UPI000382D743|nr:DNA cytosine methyltransferase [Methylopila sp. M107]
MGKLFDFKDRDADRPELIVDSFAGGGGASTGIEMALGRSPDYAINHDAVALSLHAANHPSTIHLSQNIFKVDPIDVVGRRPVGLLWASPDCKHFSKAKGGAPVQRNIRDLAWVVVKWAERAKPRVIILENVEEFRGWGPLVEHEDGRLSPCPERKGETFDKWVRALKGLGYRVEHRELRACDYGAPTIRKRLFVIARRDRRPIVWPEPSHGRPTDPDVVAGRKLPWRTAAEIIDWSLPCPSIFDTAAEIFAKHGLRAVRPLKPATMARIAKGVFRYVINAPKPFIVPVTHPHDSRVNGVDEPLRTQTAANRGEHALVAPVIAYGQQGGAVRDPQDPLHTVTASRKDTDAIVAPFVTKFREGSTGHRADEPLHTITANSYVDRPGGASPLGVVAPVLVGCGGRAGQSPARSGDAPVGTLTAKADGCVVAPFLTPRYGERPGQEPRTHSIEDLSATVVPDGNGATLVAPHLMTMRSAQKPHNAADEPVHTLTAGGAHVFEVAAFLAQHNTGVVGHPVDKPLSTVTAGGHTGMTQQALVSAGLVNMKGSERRGADVEAPAPTACAQGNHAAEVRAFLVAYYGNEKEGQSCDDPMRTVTTKDRLGLVTVGGVVHQIVDIGMRMLTPRERFNAQGFPPGYRIDADADGKRLTLEAQGRMVGNSVCPPLARALVAANCADLAVLREAAE